MKDPTSMFFPCLEGLVQIEMLVEKSGTSSYTCSRKHWSNADIYKDDSTWVEKEQWTKGFRLSAWFYVEEVKKWANIYTIRAFGPSRHQDWWMCMYAPWLWWIKDERWVYTIFYLTWNIYTFSYCKDRQVPLESQVKEKQEPYLYDLPFVVISPPPFPSALSPPLSLPDGIINHFRLMFTQSYSLRKCLEEETQIPCLSTNTKERERWEVRV